MRILHVSPYFKPARSYGGSADALYRLCLNLAAVGCDLRVLTTDADGRRRLPKIQPGKAVAVAAGLEVTYVGRVGRHTLSPGLLWRLPLEVRRAELVHLTGVYSVTALATLLACRLIGRPLVWSPRGELQRWRGSRGELPRRLWERLCRFAAPRSTVLQAASHSEREDCARRLPGIEAAVIPNAIRVPASVDHAEALPGGILRLGYIGRLHPRKGIENLLEACKLLQDRRWSLTIAGSGRRRYMRSLQARIDRLGLSAAVRLVGEVYGAAKRQLFESIDLMVLPSHAESAATAVAEALAFGVPVIVSRQTPWTCLAEHGCGLWVDNDPASLARAIGQMRAMPLAAMGQRGREWVAAEFSWESSARQVCNLYSVLLGGTPVLHETARGSIRSARELLPRN